MGQSQSQSNDAETRRPRRRRSFNDTLPGGGNEVTLSPTTSTTRITPSRNSLASSRAIMSARNFDRNSFDDDRPFTLQRFEFPRSDAITPVSSAAAAAAAATPSNHSSSNQSLAASDDSNSQQRRTRRSSSRRGLGAFRGLSARNVSNDSQASTNSSNNSREDRPSQPRRALAALRGLSGRNLSSNNSNDDSPAEPQETTWVRWGRRSRSSSRLSSTDEEPPTLVSAMNEPYPNESRLPMDDDDDDDEEEEDEEITSELPGLSSFFSANSSLAEDDHHGGAEGTPSRDDMLYYRNSSAYSIDSSVISDMDDDNDMVNDDFYPTASREYEWMGRSIENLLLGHLSAAPILHLVDPLTDDEFDDEDPTDVFFRRRSTASTFGGLGRRRSSHGSFAHGTRRGSLSLSGAGGHHGGTLASYYTRRRPPTDVDRSILGDARGRRSSTSHGPVYRRRSSMASSLSPVDQISNSAENVSKGSGPNVLLQLMARESTGKTCFPRGVPSALCLRTMGGTSLYTALDKPAAGMLSEVAFLAAAIDTGDWAETHTIVSRLVVRLIGDPNSGANASSIDDPNLPPTTPRFYAGGGRLGLERDAFVLAGGVEVMIRMFREKGFVGQEMAASFDARDLSEEIVATRLAPCWNETLAALRELVYFMPSLVTEGALDDQGDFLPFLFTLLSHDSCFDGAAALIEEILSFMSQTQPPAPAGPDEKHPPTGRPTVATSFFLGNVPDLYGLWRGFNCRQLAHFCRILALLVFEPEDRQLLESPAVLKSLELLQLRRNRASRAGRDSTVDMNQSILLGDEELVGRLLQLLAVMNYAPPLRRFSPYHIMAHFPFIADTLVMLGLGELESFAEIERQNQLAHRLLEERRAAADANTEVLLSDLGTVADMLEGLSETLMNNNNNRQQGGAPSQIGHIIQVISAAQQAGVIVGRDRHGRRRNRTRSSDEDEVGEDGQSPTNEERSVRLGDVAVDGSTIQGLASVAGILTDQILASRLYQNAAPQDDMDEGGSDPHIMGFGVAGSMGEERPPQEPRHLINTPEDASNSLQFNAMLLGPYQVEVLFVLCTLLGGRRKLDAQDLLNKLGVVEVLDDTFQRLPWYKPRGREGRHREQDNSGSQPNGIHGPGCECTPESALCVQYLRLLHNFCDRDCDNYEGRRLLLSDGEKRIIFGDSYRQSASNPGLLSKIIDAFVRESDESPYRFWLASCIESYLRGSSPMEQMFAARSGLLQHLVDDISSERLHCAGSLQTSFDLLGELSKGNSDVVRLLVVDLDEESFRKLMSVAAANLVDSNVFIRSLLLSLERFTARNGPHPLYVDTSTFDPSPRGWTSSVGTESRAYLSHSWWDMPTIALFDDPSSGGEENGYETRPSDWFPTREMVALATRNSNAPIPIVPTGLNESVGHFGWVFTPAGDSLMSSTYLPNTLERLGWFLAANQARLLRDLLGVVDLRNINHENICCLNTAVVITIFAHRRQQLADLLDELRQLNDEEKESKRRAAGKQDDVVDRAFVQAMRYLDLDQQRDTPSYARRASILNSSSQQIGDRMDVMRNFREVLWFWMEYYTHRGRDRLSLEFSSHIRFQEWNHVVSLLAADDGSSTALVRGPVRLPRSPYQRSSRIADAPIRGV